MCFDGFLCRKSFWSCPYVGLDWGSVCKRLRLVQYFPGTLGNAKETLIFTSFPLFLPISIQTVT